MKRILSLLLIAALLLALLSGCGGNGETETTDEREQVTIALWSDQLTEQYGPYLQEAFPEVDFNFYVATNSTDFYQFKMENGDLPDILTVRRFALRDVAEWKDELMDLSDTELAGSFYYSYLRSYTYSDGTVNWLPACAEVDGIIANKKLFQDNDLALPSTYEEFVGLCDELKKRGIQPFASNFGADFTCMEILQGLSVSKLTSQEGREWRQQYESGQTDELSETVWLPVFERMEEFIGYTGISSDELTNDAMDIFDAFGKEEAAMIRGTAGEAAAYNLTDRSVMLPYFGETKEDGWYLTYPAFQVAAKETEDPVRRQLILDIMAAMLNEEGQRYISGDETVIAYNKDVARNLSLVLSGMEEYIDSNQLYIRLASADMFELSQQVVQRMIKGEYDARAAFDAFNTALRKSETDIPAAARIETGYSYTFDPDGGNPAASAVMNSVREEVGARFLIGPAASVAGNIYAGDYTEAELGFLTMGESPSIVLCEMTGEQLYRYVDFVLTTPGIRGAVINDSTLYVSSGFEMTVKKTDAGYELTQLTADGSELDKEEVFTVAAIGNMTLMFEDAMEASGITEYQTSDTGYKQMIVNRLMDGRQLAEPESYITLK